MKLYCVVLQMQVNYLIMTYRPTYETTSFGCVVATILLTLKDLILKVAWYSYPPFQYELKKLSLIKDLKRTRDTFRP